MTHMEHERSELLGLASQEAMPRLLAPIEPDYKAGWQPIETLQYTGEQVLFLAPAGVVIAPALKPKPLSGLSKEDRMMLYEISGSIGGDPKYNPTHWMTLPPPPGTVVPDYKAERDLLARAVICPGNTKMYQEGYETAQRILKEIEDE